MKSDLTSMTVISMQLQSGLALTVSRIRGRKQWTWTQNHHDLRTSKPSRTSLDCSTAFLSPILSFSFFFFAPSFPSTCKHAQAFPGDSALPLKPVSKFFFHHSQNICNRKGFGTSNCSSLFPRAFPCLAARCLTLAAPRILGLSVIF